MSLSKSAVEPKVGLVLRPDVPRKCVLNEEGETSLPSCVSLPTCVSLAGEGDFLSGVSLKRAGWAFMT